MAAEMATAPLDGSSSTAALSGRTAQGHAFVRTTVIVNASLEDIIHGANDASIILIITT